MNESFVDLTGQRFGKLTVIKREPKQVGRRQLVGWLCQCDCGGSFIALSNDLRSGKTVSCKCARKTTSILPPDEKRKILAQRARNWRAKQRELNPPIRPEHGNGFVDLTGQVFGRLTVVRVSNYKIRKTRKACWVCDCACGREKIVVSEDLVNGAVQSCGCLRNTLQDLSPEERVEHERVRNNKRMRDWRKIWATPKRCRRHGITLEIYKEALEKQDGVCWICHQANNNGWPLVIDHKHSCCPGPYGCRNCFRGLLCLRCNSALGLMDDDTERLARSIQYLDGNIPIWNPPLAVTVKS